MLFVKMIFIINFAKQLTLQKRYGDAKKKLRNNA